MILKSKLYKKEQEEICDKIITILELDNENLITLFELDNDKEKQSKRIKCGENKELVEIYKLFFDK